MEYNFREIEKKWHQKWVENKTYKVTEDENKKKFYVLNMFPYPSGAGLHVGHPLGYIASDIYARYKRLNGFNVLNPMGYDAYGLPAEQYAIQTGQHPEVTTVANINRYREQLDKIGFSFDWDREVRTCDPKYYHWTQWAFQKMFNSFFCNGCQKAQPIEKLIKRFEEKGSADLNVAQNEQIDFTAEEWNSYDDVKKQQILMNYRIAYLGETMVNWCPGLVGVPVYSEPENKDVLSIADHAIQQAKTNGNDVVIVDTAGRLAIDEQMMNEISNLKNHLRPDETLFVVDSMTGQDAVNTAKEFNDRLDFNGVVLTKLDGDTRGGAALSIRTVVTKPIKFIGTGEKMDAIDVFHPARMADRILGMGDVVSLVERAQEHIQTD